MINSLLVLLVRALLWFRYRIRTHDLDSISRKGRTGVLFLPNHPALIDPVILASRLIGPFHVRALADRDQTDRFLIRRLVRRFRMLPIPDLSKPGPGSADEVRKVVSQCVQALRSGDNLLLYPAGGLQSRRTTEISANSAVHSILREIPGLRVVLVRTEGLWGSSFSRAGSVEPDVPRIILRGFGRLLLSGLFFAPRRKVDITFTEPSDLPRSADRASLNRWLENFYNSRTSPNIRVPYTIWDRTGPRELPDPEPRHVEGDPALVTPATRDIVSAHLRQLVGVERFSDDTQLARDLGMDSLARLELVAWLQSEFGFPPGDTDSLKTVGDVMLAASGHALSSGPKSLAPVPPSWFIGAPDPAPPPDIPDLTIPQAFLLRASMHPNAVAVADQTSGVKTYRDLVLAVLALRPALSQLPGERLGLMLPASVAADVLFLASLFSGKTPAMINWTLGRANLEHCLKLVDIRHVLTSRVLVSRLEAQGIDLSPLRDRFLFVEDLAAKISLSRKLSLWLRSRLSWRALEAAHIPDVAVVLFTSGSENFPKAVPLSHRNILANLRDACTLFALKPSHALLGILPPFHSFGLTASVVLPLVSGTRAVYYPNPTDGLALGRIIHAYRATLLLGTPTFLSGILRASSPDQLASLRLVVTGAEKCPPRVYEAVRRKSPQTIVMEGFGVTECSPVVSCNSETDSRPGTIGRVLASLEYAIVDPQLASRVPPGQTGMLLVRGPSVFSGYLNYDGPSPFVPFEGKSWYRTGDLVTESSDRVLTFAGRLKRFVKLGGEMISLPAIEAVLAARYQSEDDDKPTLAVVSTPDEEKPELVLFTTKDLSREDVNSCIRSSGLSGLHNIRRIILLPDLPLLGTGKTDYRALSSRLTS